MNRRSFLQLLGLAPIAPTVLAAMPEPTPAIKLAFPHPWLPPDTLPVSEFARQEIERITGVGQLPQATFRGVNVGGYGRSPMMDALPLCREWNSGMTDDLLREIDYQFPDEPDRIPSALRA